MRLPTFVPVSASGFGGSAEVLVGSATAAASLAGRAVAIFSGFPDVAGMGGAVGALWSEDDWEVVGLGIWTRSGPLDLELDWPGLGTMTV